MIQLAPIIPGIVGRIAENSRGESTEVVVSALYSRAALKKALDAATDEGGDEVLLQMRLKSGDSANHKYLLCMAGVECDPEGLFPTPDEWVGVAPIEYRGGL